MRQRDRLTITLPREMIAKIDSLVDELNVHNRSHAIEKLIEKVIQPRIDTAVILAGGKSAKFRAPFKLIGEKYLLAVMLEQLKLHGVIRVIICGQPQLLAEIKLKFGDGEMFGLKLELVDEPLPLGTAGAIRAIKHLLPEAPFLVLHGDVLSNINIGEFLDFHRREAGLATIAVKPRLSERSYGRVKIQGNQIVEFLPTGVDQGISIVNTGIYVVEPKLLQTIKPGEKTFLETDVFPKLAKKGQLNAFLFQGVWHDVSSLESRQLAMVEWKHK